MGIYTEVAKETTAVSPTVKPARKRLKSPQKRTPVKDTVSPSTPTPPKSEDRTSPPKSVVPSARPADRPVGSTPVRHKKRVRVRYAFEFYQDQILRLKEMRRSSIANDEEIEFSMSEYVRQALDEKLSNG